MKIETTGRGFVIAHFKDGNGEACSLQKSSAAERDMIWLGVDDPNPQFFPGDGTGWHPYPLPENVQCSTRMHLTRERVAELLPLLQGFVETGELVESPPKSVHWVATSERLPPTGYAVLVSGDGWQNVAAHFGERSDVGWLSCQDGLELKRPTHWMLLPDAPIQPHKPWPSHVHRYERQFSGEIACLCGATPGTAHSDSSANSNKRPLAPSPSGVYGSSNPIPWEKK